MNKRLCACVAILAGLNVGGNTTGWADTGERMQTGSTPPGYTLRITGSDETVAFSGVCWVRQKDRSEQRVPIEGSAPYSRELSGYGLRCDISQESSAGLLTVEIFSKSGGNRTRSRTQGVGSRVRVQMR